MTRVVVGYPSWPCGLGSHSVGASRTWCPDGTGYTIEGITVAPPDETEAHFKAVISALNYTGVGCLQFLVDEESGAAHFLELNPRLASGNAISQYCGVDLPLLTMKLSHGIDVEERPADYPLGVRFVWTYGDLSSLHAAWHRKELGLPQSWSWFMTSIRAFLRADMHLTWCWRDPLPTLRRLADVASKQRTSSS